MDLFPCSRHMPSVHYDPSASHRGCCPSRLPAAAKGESTNKAAGTRRPHGYPGESNQGKGRSFLRELSVRTGLVQGVELEEAS